MNRYAWRIEWQLWPLITFLCIVFCTEESIYSASLHFLDVWKCTFGHHFWFAFVCNSLLCYEADNREGNGLFWFLPVCLLYHDCSSLFFVSEVIVHFSFDMFWFLFNGQFSVTILAVVCTISNVFDCTEAVKVDHVQLYWLRAKCTFLQGPLK